MNNPHSCAFKKLPIHLFYKSLYKDTETCSGWCTDPRVVWQLTTATGPKLPPKQQGSHTYAVCDTLQHMGPAFLNICLRCAFLFCSELLVIKERREWKTMAFIIQRWTVVSMELPHVGNQLKVCDFEGCGERRDWESGEQAIQPFTFPQIWWDL